MANASTHTCVSNTTVACSSASAAVQRTLTPTCCSCTGGARPARVCAASRMLFQHTYRVHLIDLPGFGDAPLPPESWDTIEYADLVRTVHAEHVRGTCHPGGSLVRRPRRAAHGVAAPVRVRGWSCSASRGCRRVAGPRVTRLAHGRPLAPACADGRCDPCRVRPARLAHGAFGSKDYLAAGRDCAVLVRTVNEDLTESARRHACPTLLVYGTDDTETPPWLAHRYRDLIGSGRRSTCCRTRTTISMSAPAPTRAATDRRWLAGRRWHDRLWPWVPFWRRRTSGSCWRRLLAYLRYFQQEGYDAARFLRWCNVRPLTDPAFWRRDRGGAAVPRSTRSWRSLLFTVGASVLAVGAAGSAASGKITLKMTWRATLAVVTVACFAVALAGFVLWCAVRCVEAAGAARRCVGHVQRCCRWC